jgi:hypothetical protein
MTTRRALLTGLLVAVGLAAAPVRPVGLDVAVTALPARLSDQQFWRLVSQFSEQGGPFHSENFVSNEGRFQFVLPELEHRTTPGGLYIGVGPEQNFTYITTVRPRMAFIIDIRRGNLREHLLYKALMEMSPDRASFLSRLFSRERPAGLTPEASAQDLFAAYDALPATDSNYRRNLAAVIEWLTTKRRLPLSAEDIAGIDHIYRTAFFADGPDLGYRLTGQGRNSQHPTYAYLMSMDDGQGRQRSYLANETNFRFLKDLQARNLIVPVVGDFGGARALPAIAKYARDAGTTVSAFYLSNVEQYLMNDGTWRTFCATVSSMPLDTSSTFIRSRVNGRGLVGPLPFAGVGMFWSGLGSMEAETRACATGAAPGFLPSF